MTDIDKEHQKNAVVATLEEMLSELDKQKLFLPALKIVEALEILIPVITPETSSDNGQSR
jgi:hypothetical protein